MSLRKLCLTAALVFMVSAAAPAKASAEWILTPFTGVNFGAAASFASANTVKDEFGRSPVYGATLRKIRDQHLGFEIDFGYTPKFFRTATSGPSYGDNSLVTASANVVWGGHGPGFVTYGTGGLTVMRSKLESPSVLVGNLSGSNIGFNVGAGFHLSVLEKLGMRAEARYFRALNKSSEGAAGVSLGDLKFIRGTFGVSFTF